MSMGGHDEAYMMNEVNVTMEGLRRFKGLRRLGLRFRTRASLACRERCIAYIKDWKTEESLFEFVMFGSNKYGDWREVEKWAV